MEVFVLSQNKEGEDMKLTKKDVLQYAEQNGYEAAMDLMLLAGPDGFDGTATEYNILFDDVMEAFYNTGRQ